MPFDVLLNIEPTERPRAADGAALGAPTRLLVSAGTCTEIFLPEAEAYVQSGIASATKRAYRADLDHFRALGGSLPATDAQITTTSQTTPPC